MGKSSTLQLIEDVTKYANRGIFLHKDITRDLKHDRGAIRKILKIFVKNKWLKEDKIGVNIIYIRNFFTRQSYIDSMIKLEILQETIHNNSYKK